MGQDYSSQICSPMPKTLSDEAYDGPVEHYFALSTVHSVYPQDIPVYLQHLACNRLDHDLTQHAFDILAC